jgi:hypothetical protein
MDNGMFEKESTFALCAMVDRPTFSRSCLRCATTRQVREGLPRTTFGAVGGAASARQPKNTPKHAKKASGWGQMILDEMSSAWAYKPLGGCMNLYEVI